MISEERITKLIVAYVKRVKISGLENKEDSRWYQVCALISIR